VEKLRRDPLLRNNGREGDPGGAIRVVPGREDHRRHPETFNRRITTVKRPDREAAQDLDQQDTKIRVTRSSGKSFAGVGELQPRDPRHRTILPWKIAFQRAHRDIIQPDPLDQVCSSIFSWLGLES
jgi:hypothetical protein